MMKNLFAYESILNSSCTKKDGRLFFVSEERILSYEPEAYKGINVVKTFLKRFPSLYEFLRAVISPGFSCNRKLTPQKAVSRLFPAKSDKVLLLSIGSGTKIIREDVVNLDLYPYENVDFVADIMNLPFKDNSLDMVICESVLEHVPDPDKVIAEMARVVKIGGYVYVSVPFIYPFHASPNDYFRWSQAGLKTGFIKFAPLEQGMRAGPMAALQGILSYVFAMIFSLGNNFLYLFFTQFFTLIFSPVKLLDFPLGYINQSHEIAADIYLLCQKK